MRSREGRVKTRSFVLADEAHKLDGALLDGHDAVEGHGDTQAPFGHVRPSLLPTRGRGPSIHFLGNGAASSGCVCDTGRGIPHLTPPLVLLLRAGLITRSAR